MNSLKWTERLLLDLAEIGLLVSFSRMVSSNSDINIRKLCLFMALVMETAPVVGQEVLVS
jgi:hypothetical protein